jgi:serine protease
MKMTHGLLAVLLGVAVLAGCSEGPAPANDAASPPAKSATPAASDGRAKQPVDIRPATNAVPPGPAALEAQKAERKDTLGKIRAQWRGKKFEDFLAKIYKEPFEGGKYIVSGDIAVVDEKQLRELFEQRIQGDADNAVETDPRLIVMAGANGTWNAQKKKQITYCVSNTFGARHDKVVADMLAASGAWQAVADVRFIHSADQDAACTPNNANVVFDVRPVSVAGQYYARSFFPNESRPGRNVLIDDSSFTLAPTANLQLVGVLRHELGHTLGWRHEHTRPESGKCFEDSDWVPMTAYDHLSVMHYPQCNGGGDWKLLLTRTDESGAACVYGPAPGFTIDQSLVSTNCPTPVTPPSAPGTAQTKTFASQSVSKDKSQTYGPFGAKPGTVVTVDITSVGGDRGDADLYVNLGRAPDLGDHEYACRPYLSGSNESCEISALTSPRNNVYFTVNGYSAARYDVKVVYFPN